MNPQPLEPVLRLPTRLRSESDRVLNKAHELLGNYRVELAQIREQTERLNACEPGSGLYSLYSGMGIDFQGGGPFQDQQALPGTLALANSYFPVSLNWTLLSNSYMTQGLLRTIVDQVVDDAFGDGIEFKTAQLDDEELKTLNRTFKTQRDPASYKGTKMQKINLDAGYDLSNSDLEAVKQTGKWGRLFGGSGLIINTTQAMDKDFRADMIGIDTPLTFIAADRWELVLDAIDIMSSTNPTPYNYYGNRLNRTRVSRFIWAQAPSRIRRRLQGWGMSVLEESIRPVNAYLKFEKLMFELIDEAKVDVFKIQGYNTQLLSAKGTQQLQARIQVANQVKNFQNAITMDKNDEYEQKNLGAMFPGLAGIYEQLRINLCAYLKLPMNKLFGQSAGGFGSGKDSLDNYNSTVRNFRSGIEPVVARAGGLRCQQLYGFVPDDLVVGWIPLAVLNGVEQEAVKTSQQNRIIQRFTTGLTTGPEAMQEMRKNELVDCDETELEQGLRDVDPPPTQNSDEAAAGQEHDLTLAGAKAADKKEE